MPLRRIPRGKGFPIAPLTQAAVLDASSPPGDAVVRAPAAAWTVGRRLREPMVRRWRPAWPVLALVALLHAGFVLLVRQAMRLPASPAQRHAPRGEVLEIRFLPAARTPAAAPSPPAPVALPRRHAPAAASAWPVAVPAHAASVARPRLFDADGVPLLPAAAATAPPLPEYVQHMPPGDPRLMRHDSPIRYQATRFDRDWNKGSGSAVDDALQKAVDKTTVKHTFRLPGGIRLHCGVSLAMLAGGCGGDPPPPPSRKDGDVRLDMAPAPLAPNPHAAEPPTLAACIALYRAGKPLADGCPSDTPLRAVDEELRGH